MKVGIVTQPLGNNYGGLLQNYALQTVLKRMGFEPITLDQPIFKPRSIINIILVTTKDILKNCIRLALYKRTVQELTYESEKRISKIGVNTQNFIDEYINKSPKLYGKKAEYRYCIENNIKSFIVGSDQVWRKEMNCRLPNSFLDFAVNIEGKKLAYAASFGIDTWNFNTEETREIRHLIKNFNGVSCRESSGVKLCKDYLGIKAELVLDPTMLLDKEDYLNIVNQKNNQNVNLHRLFTYILDGNKFKDKIVRQVSKNKNLETFSISVYGDNKTTKESVSVEEWLNAFNTSDFVVCDSFHAAVFSIIFNKDFIVLSNEGRGNARFLSLLKLFNLERRLISDITELSIVNEPINWELVNQKRLEMKKKSIDFLSSKLD